MAATSSDEFVDLYEVLDLPVDSDTETIRQRLNVLYLEAQQNLDHRNIKKRLQYQQMYEIYLPQGRHLLLDPRRRGEYDRYLNAYRTGDKVAPSSTPAEESSPSPSELSEIEEPPIPGMAEVQVDPEVLAAERENMWAKWKVGLEDAAETGSETAVSLPTTEKTETSDAPSDAGENASAARPAPPTPRVNAPPTPRAAGGPTVPRTAPPPPRPGAAGRGRPGPPLASASSAPHYEAPPAPDSTGDIERQREQQRYTLIHEAVQYAGLVWGGVYAGGIFLVGLIILFIIDSSIKTYPFDMSRSVFDGLCFLAILGIAVVGGMLARRNAETRASDRYDNLSTEELMRLNR